MGVQLIINKKIVPVALTVNREKTSSAVGTAAVGKRNKWNHYSYCARRKQPKSVYNYTGFH